VPTLVARASGLKSDAAEKFEGVNKPAFTGQEVVRPPTVGTAESARRAKREVAWPFPRVFVGS